ncbi:helix-turn-helix domain-containing protein [Segeticoccus rhizosphaerae]|uniref:helix-turn-helix domain-containing protein n=1 Tax=Segeticoccus rhizosphaerae TaxID=1104777 RepID=UPI001264A757|nr:helix-turn-helix transcriptional regulator [Segeticoccus rhizosphaerae]
MSTTRTSHDAPSGVMLAALREGAGLSIRALAAEMTAAGSSISHGHLARVENGERVMTPQLYRAAADAIARHIEKAGSAA